MSFVGANLHRTDLRGATLFLATFNQTLLHGADLRTTLHVNQAQIDLTDGDASTALPGNLRRPAAWGVE